jgi:hypothetical protein
MKREKIVELYNVLFKLHEDKISRKAALWVLKNLKKLKDEVELIQEVARPSEEFIEFEKKRFNIIVDKADKDESGNPILERDSLGRQQFRIINKLTRNEIQRDIETLSEKYKDVIDLQMKKEKELQSLLQEEIDLPTLSKINFDDLPDNISPKELDVIEFLVDGIEED